MIRITTYQSDELPEHLRQLLHNNYSNERNYNFFLSEYEKAYNFCCLSKHVEFIPISGYLDNKLLSHIALIIDDRLSSNEAFFGFFEMPNDNKIFNQMWDKLISEARKRDITKIKGPVNGSIWHQYRCYTFSDNSNFFKTELPTKLYYYSQMLSKKPIDEITYHSGSREHYDHILPIIQKGYGALEKSEFHIEELQTVSHHELIQIASISKTIFSASWGYTELTPEEFLALYSTEKVASHLSRLYVLYKKDVIIGFCSTITEDKTTLICKTICILPEHQGMGLGNALAYKVHIDAKELGYTKIIYALIRDANKVKHFPKTDVEIFRRYATFEFSL